MIRLPQKSKAKRGFTLIEMIVVIAIIAVLAAVILPSMNIRNSLKKEAESNAKNFYVVAQNIFTKYSLYEAPLTIKLKNDLKDKKAEDFIQYYPAFGGNFPYNYDPTNKSFDTTSKPAAADVYVEVKIIDNRITETIVDNSWENILKRDTKTSELASVFQTELDASTTMPDGYYYAKVSYAPANDGTAVGSTYVLGTVKVAWAAYRESELPKLTGAYSNYKDTVLNFKNDSILSDDSICGVCAAWNGQTMPDGTTKTTVGFEKSCLE